MCAFQSKMSLVGIVALRTRVSAPLAVLCVQGSLAPPFAPLKSRVHRVPSHDRFMKRRGPAAREESAVTDPRQPVNTDRLAADLLHKRGRGLAAGDPLAAPIVPASNFHLPVSTQAPYQYARFHNPTWDVVEGALGHLEQAETIVFPSGMAACAAVLYAVLKAGDRLLLPSDGYYTVRALANRFLAPLGVAIDTCPTVEMTTLDLTPYRMVWLETPSNPGLDVVDIELIAQRAKGAGALVVVDNTTMTPFGQRPLDLGAHVVVSSDTKAINGHSDVLFGHVSTRDADLVAAIREWRKLGGAIPGPFEAWQVYRGLETLEVRFARMCETAGVVAARLAAHEKVHEVRYPGLATDPAHAIAKRQMATFGFLIGVTFADQDAAERVIARCSMIRPATSFGGVHTTAERRARWGDQVKPGFVRLSIGVEPTKIIADEIILALSQA